MERGDLDIYVATFNKLITLARYTDAERGTLTYSKRGSLPY